MPKWFWKGVGWIVAIAIVFIVGNAVIHDPAGSAAKVKDVGNGLGQIAKFFESL